jgi:polar amino acid transport system substrate-binding protein
MRIPRSVGAVALVALFAVTACGSSNSSPSASGSASGSARPSSSASTASSSAPSSSSAAPSTAAPSVATIPIPADQLVFATKLLICSDLPYPPQEFFDDQGNPIGSDIEIGQEIARRLGLEPVVVNSVFDTIIAAVNGGKCDIIISAQNITTDRKKQVDMIPFFQAGQSFVVAKGNPDGIKTQQDLCGKAIAAETGTTEVDYLQGTGDFKGKGLSTACTKAGQAAIDVKTFSKDSDALLALQGQQVSAYFADSPVAGYYVTQHPDAFELSGLTLGVTKEGISVSKDKTGVRDSVKRALNAMVADGTYLAILTKYGIQDGSIFK